MLPTTLLDRLDIGRATERELSSSSGLLPPRADQQALVTQPEEVAALVRSSLRKEPAAKIGSTIFASKQKGSRPLSYWRLQDRILYRALVDLIADSLPSHLRNRPDFDTFARKPLENTDTLYISAADISSYYVYVDHEMLVSELISQTGDYEAVAALSNNLAQVMGRRIGLPQVHESSDILGDTYIDPIRRKLIRSGFDTYTFSDDFRIGSKTLGQARTGLELCASAALELGLVLNELKTYTFSRIKYRTNLDSRSEAEQRILSDERLTDAAAQLLRSKNKYDDERPPQSNLDLHDLDGFGSEPLVSNLPQSANVDTANHVWTIWSDPSSPNQSAPVIRSLLGLLLPTLGKSGNSGPLDKLDYLLTRAPDLTPVVAKYLIEYSDAFPNRISSVQDKVNEITSKDRLSDWQKLWLAYVAGEVRTTGPTPSYVPWLEHSVESASGPVSGYAALALGKLRQSDPEKLAAALTRAGEEWTPSIIWAIGQIKPEFATTVAGSSLERLLINYDS